MTEQLRILVCGLGNSGARHTRNRHNAGRLIVEALLERANALNSSSIRLEPDRNARGRRAEAPVRLRLRKGDETTTPVALTFFCPEGYMNTMRIPRSLQHLTPVIVYDELEHNLRVVKRRYGGSASGHNGLRSIGDTLKEETWRLRIGIGRPASRDSDDVADYVLSNFEPEELEQLKSETADSAWKTLAAICSDILTGAKTRVATLDRSEAVFVAG